jgi:hypothetical protein
VSPLSWWCGLRPLARWRLPTIFCFAMWPSPYGLAVAFRLHGGQRSEVRATLASSPFGGELGWLFFWEALWVLSLLHERWALTRVSVLLGGPKHSKSR